MFGSLLVVKQESDECAFLIPVVYRHKMLIRVLTVSFA